jgi:dTDP-4-amino-4,6-dideoxygalactose transaminase
MLSALELPVGSEVLVSAITIPDVGRILKEHGLVSVPVEVDYDTLAPSMSELERLSGSRTRAVLFAHLFGARVNLSPLAEFAQRKGLLLWEDCAQAYVGDDYSGHPKADVAFFSFGAIKTMTALGGALLSVRDPSLRDAMAQKQARLPEQSSRAFRAKCVKYALLKSATHPLAYGALTAICSSINYPRSALLSAATRGFSDANLLAQLRLRPGAPLLSLMHRRLTSGCGDSVLARKALGDRMRERLGVSFRVPGAHADYHSYWLFPVLAARPNDLCQYLEARGFEATATATRLGCISASENHPEAEAPTTRAWMSQVVYLPVYPELGEDRFNQLCAALVNYSSGSSN